MSAVKKRAISHEHCARTWKREYRCRCWGYCHDYTWTDLFYTTVRTFDLCCPIQARPSPRTTRRDSPSWARTLRSSSPEMAGGVLLDERPACTFRSLWWTESFLKDLLFFLLWVLVWFPGKVNFDWQSTSRSPDFSIYENAFLHFIQEKNYLLELVYCPYLWPPHTQSSHILFYYSDNDS